MFKIVMHNTGVINLWYVVSCVSIIFVLTKKNVKINFDTNFFSIDLLLERQDTGNIIKIIRCIN
jgi:hypothetical protein